MEARRRSEELFTYTPDQPILPADYRIYHQSGILVRDPYTFLPTLGEVDHFLFNKGCHYQLYNVLGAHPREWHGVQGTQFAVWAPNAETVSLVADFNHWDSRYTLMRSLGASGIWEIFVPGIGEGEKYKFAIRTKQGSLVLKSDPYAFYSQVRPETASVVWDLTSYAWQDQAWMEQRKHLTLQRPINIYEAHLGSWKAGRGYRELAEELASYCQEMGFTHIEIMPVLEHPLDESWGYQVSGFFAATSRYGTPSDFKYFIDTMHRHQIGVILDWVGAHFPWDDFSLSRFDGTALYEHDDRRKGLHPHWNTAIFNYGRPEVVNFLMASALFWLEEMHLDGLRVDAVASMLYLDYGRKEGEWLPNPDGSRYNIEAIEFLKHLNAIAHERCPGTLMIAEESSSYMGVTHREGLGFDLKWNMGWMNDSLTYFSRDPIYRKYHQNDLTFSLLYAFSERFLLPLSHDEVVHMKQSLLVKMPGTEWQRFANLRLLYGYQICHPGKKLLFMGGELAQWTEWDCKGELDWALLGFPNHQGIHHCVKDLNHFYHAHPALWACDFEWSGYEWIDFADAERSVLIYWRRGGGEQLICIHNFTPEYHGDYRISLPHHLKRIREIFNSDAECYGGSGKCNGEMEVLEGGCSIQLAPLSTVVFSVTD